MKSRKQDFGILTAIVVCLLFSGAGSLVLEVVWSRLLRLVFGSTTLAISTILVAYMLGLGLGGLFGGRLAARVRNGIKAYGLFEVIVALYALTVPFILEAFPYLNRTLLMPLSYWPAAIIRFLVVLMVLLLPTLLMGATLPVLVAALASENSKLAKRVGLLYGINTLGAVSGVLAATFVFFPLVGVAYTNVIGALLDLVVGLIAIFILAPRWSASHREAPKPSPPKRSPEDLPRRRWSIPVLAYGLIGFSALVYEVSWTRALSMVLGSSVYAFAMMLAAFLTGIALGSLVGRVWFDKLSRPYLVYAAAAASLGVLAYGTLASLRLMPHVLLRVLEWGGLTGGYLVLASIPVSMLVMLPPALVLGALFPLVIRTASSEQRKGSGTVGDVYFVNTIGSAAGAFFAGFLLIPGIGIERTIDVAMTSNFIVAAILLVWKRDEAVTARRFGLLVCVVLAALVWVGPTQWKQEEMTTGVYYKAESFMSFGIDFDELGGLEKDEILYYRDGLNTTVSMHSSRFGLDMRLNGKTDASLGDMSTQSFSGHIPMLFGGPAADALVVGYASGVTTGVVSLYDAKRIDVVEIEPVVLEGSRFFDDYNYRPQENPRVKVIVEDGRTHILATDRRYDVVISEPSNPWISGASSLFTREYFQMVHKVLKPGGRLLQWIQLYDMDPEGIYAILFELKREFPHVYAFLNGPSDVDLLLLSTTEELTSESLPRWQEIPFAARKDLARVGIHSEKDLWSLFRLSDETIASLAARATTGNTDDNMFIELHAPFSMYTGTFSNSLILKGDRSGVLDLADRGPEPADGRSVAELALSYGLGRGDRDLATSLLSEAAHRGDSPEYHVALAELGRRFGGMTTDEAIERLDRAVSLDANAFLPRFHRGKAFFEVGRLAEALGDMNHAASLRPEDYRPQLFKLRILGATGRAKEARVIADRLLGDKDVATFERKVWADAAIISAQMGEFDRAVEEMRKYLQSFPLASAEWELLARMYEALGSKDKAAEASENARKARHNGVVQKHRRARLLESYGFFERSRQILESVLAAEPDNALAAEDLLRIEEAISAKSRLR